MRQLLLLMFVLCLGVGTARAEVSMSNPVSLERIPIPSTTCGYPCNRVAVIFIHGITGDRTTWVNGTADWPQLLAEDTALRREIGDMDVFRVEYYSTRNDGPSVPSISKALAKKLDDVLFGRGYSKIVMVCHSLGGIFCREHLLHVKLRWGHPYLSLFKATIALGTPLKGSDQADRWIIRASANEQVRVLRPIDVNDFLALLNNSTEEFTEKRETLGCPEVQFYAGYEKQDTPLIPGTSRPAWRIVTKTSATAGVNIRNVEGFDKDHFELVKPADRSDRVYEWVAGILRTCGPNGGTCSEPLSSMCGRPPWLTLRPQ